MPRVFVAGVPAPQGSKRYLGRGKGGGIRMAESSKRVGPWRERIAGEVSNTWARDPIRGHAVNVSVRFLFNRPKSHYRSGRNAELIRDGAPRHPATRPDVDKLIRAVLDGLAGVVFVDDCQVAMVAARKEWTNGPAGAEISWDVLR